MSLINQMLRDLDARRASEQLAQDGVVTGTTNNPAARRSSGPIILLSAVIVILFIALAALGWLHLNSTATASASHMDKPGVVKAAAPKPAAVEPSRAAETVHDAPAAPTVVTERPAPATADEAEPTPIEAPDPVTPSPAPAPRIDRISPARLRAQQGLQQVSVLGSHFEPGCTVEVRWPGGGSILDDRVEYLDTQQLTVKLRTGTRADSWTLRVINPNGSSSDSIALQIEPPLQTADTDIAGDDLVEENPDVLERVEKRIRPLSAAEQAERHYQQGIGLLQQGQGTRAEEALRQAIGSDAEHLRAWETLAGLLINAGRAVEATELLARARRHHPAQGTLAQLHARLLLDTQGAPAAINELERTAAVAPQSGDYLAFMGGLYQQQERYTDSRDAYRKALALKPQQGTWWMGLAIALEKLGDKPGAVSAYRKAAESHTLNKRLQSFVAQRLKGLETETAPTALPLVE